MDLDTLVKMYNHIEEAITKEIMKLPSYGKECNCGEPDEFTSIFFGDIPEIETNCLNCGGYILDV